MKRAARSVVLLLPLLAWPAAGADTGRTADGARRSGKDVCTEAEQARNIDSAQPEVVRGRELAVNLFLCANGLPGCDESLLSPEQRARFMVNRPAQQ